MPYDPAKAKKLLAEAGYPNGFDAVLKVAPQYYYTVRTAEVLVNQFAKVGIRAKIEQIEWGQWLAQVWKDANYDMSIIGHAEAWDIGNFANPNYYFRWDNPEFRRLFKESEVTVDDKKRREIYVEDAEHARRRGARGVAVHAPPPRGGQEGRHGHLEGPPGPLPRPVRGRLAARALRRVHLLRWRPRPHAQRTESTPRVRPSGAASHMDPSQRSRRCFPTGFSGASRRKPRAL